MITYTFTFEYASVPFAEYIDSPSKIEDNLLSAIEDDKKDPAEEEEHDDDDGEDKTYYDSTSSIVWTFIVLAAMYGLLILGTFIMCIALKREEKKLRASQTTGIDIIEENENEDISEAENNVVE